MRYPPWLKKKTFQQLWDVASSAPSHMLQYIPRNMHTVFALLCFVVVIHWLIFPYPSGLLHWHSGNLTIAPMPAKQPWWIWINTSCEFIMNDCITTTKQSTTKPCAYLLGYTVNNWWKCIKKASQRSSLDKYWCHRATTWTRLCFYQTRSAWSRDQGSNKNLSPAYNFAPTVTKFCVMWEGLSLPHDTKFCNCRCKIVDSKAFPIWSLIHGSSWSGLIKAEPGLNALSP